MPTLEEAKEWTSELLKEATLEKDFKHYKRFMYNHFDLDLQLWHGSPDVITFDYRCEMGGTYFRIPPTKEEFKQVLKLTGVI